ncbi:hypothetical protein C1H46_041027 [Malus baccata]|uniref:Uncharacterized protein n=1 Tax=Malus baccata TaxID=106549 RepID=A0A540KGW7_MALBA|nr:hypothetical protein C1H46_041027 [Malus baccata]
MSNLIRSRKAVTTTPRSPPPTHSSTATAPAQMDHFPVGPGVSQAMASPTSSVALPVSAKRAKKNTWGSCLQLKTAKITWVTNGHITIGYDEQHWAAPMAEQHSALAHDIGHVALEKDCLKEFEGREDNWAWLCSHFQEPSYVKKVKANKSNRDKKTILYHFGLRPFSYRMEAQRRVIIKGIQNSRRSMSLATFMFDPGMSWPSPFIDDDGEEAVGSSGVRLLAYSRDSTRVCGSPRGCKVSDSYGDLGSNSRAKAGDIL